MISTLRRRVVPTEAVADRPLLKPFFSTVVRTVYTLSTRAAFAIATFTLMMLGRSKFDTPNKAPKRAR
jgi:hypothetical protein